ncbi:hypothetical protein [Streptomyces xiamenensis]|uniref:hypothetical protein n=1 Tax=Streptomyces xiamenensis TaxID=408015 RepID=UPI0035D58F80
MTTDLDLHPAPILWGYSADSCPTVGKPADWQMARLAVQAGDLLAQHTRRPTPSEHPPRTPAGVGSLVQDGWVRARGWPPDRSDRRTALAFGAGP